MFPTRTKILRFRFMIFLSCSTFSLLFNVDTLSHSNYFLSWAFVPLDLSWRKTGTSRPFPTSTIRVLPNSTNPQLALEPCGQDGLLPSSINLEILVLSFHAQATFYFHFCHCNGFLGLDPKQLLFVWRVSQLPRYRHTQQLHRLSFSSSHKKRHRCLQRRIQSTRPSDWGFSPFHCGPFQELCFLNSVFAWTITDLPLRWIFAKTCSAYFLWCWSIRCAKTDWMVRESLFEIRRKILGK